MLNHSTLEQEMINEGKARYHDNKSAAHSRGDLSTSETLHFKEAVGDVIKALDDMMADAEGKRGRKPVWMEAVASIGSVQAAVVGLRTAFTSAISKSAYATLCISIGKQIELEQIAKMLAERDEDLLKAMVKRAKNFNRTDKVLESFDVSLHDEGIPRLPETELAKIGAGVFNAVVHATGFFQMYMANENSPQQFIQVEFSQEFADTLSHTENMQQWMRPVYRFMVSEPKPWTALDTGCYYDEKLASTNPLVKTFNPVQRTKVAAKVAADAPFLKAVNLIQRVPFAMNAFIVEMVQWAAASGLPVKKFPEPVLMTPPDASEGRKREIRKINTERRATKAQFESDLSEAVKFALEHPDCTIWEPAWLDWRSRVYAKPSLNHQRTDYCKAMFQFKNGKKILDKKAEDWLAIHLANSGDFGKMSKKPMMDRIKWVTDNETRIIEMANNPKRDLWWMEADSPFCFLAAAKAWADYRKDPENYICHLPIAIDGSNSGLQHFSALLRDPIGAALVCLAPDDIPADVYQKVADVVKERCNEMLDDEMAQKWLTVGIDRKLTKTCVMTYVYGSRVYGFGDHIADCIRELSPEKQALLGTEKEDQLKAAFWMAKMVWEAVQKTVEAAAAAMDWLQGVAGLLAKENKPVEWTTPVGFPVINAYYEPVSERVELFLVGKSADLPKTMIKPRINAGFTNKLRGKKQRSSISPNAIHSMDSSHLMLAVLKADSYGINDYLLIHDSFACLPADMDQFSKAVRESFVEMYQNYDLLEEIYMYALSALSEDGRKRLEAPPKKGTFDITEILKSEYAFA